MRVRDAKKLEHGLYVIHWKEGGLSVAAVGSDEKGRRWYMPTNFVYREVSFDWKIVLCVELLTTQSREAMKRLPDNYDYLKYPKNHNL